MGPVCLTPGMGSQLLPHQGAGFYPDTFFSNECLESLQGVWGISFFKLKTHIKGHGFFTLRRGWGCVGKTF